MLSVASAASSADYYGQDNYYEDDGHAFSGWLGQGAAALGLEGEVDRGDYDRLYKGEITDDIRLGTYREGEWQHYSGWDLTFNAPKSVTLMAEVAGDRRLVDAHDRAVREAFAWIERELAITRVRHGDRVEHVRTGNLVAAVYRHDLSREQEPHLHSHVVVMNATLDANGGWQSLFGRAFFRQAKQAGLIYQQALARSVRELGYEIIPRSNGTAEIAGVPRAAIERFSHRSKEVEDHLAAKGLDRESASVREREVAAVTTRAPKAAANRDDLRAEWQGVFGRYVDYASIAERAQERAASADYQRELRLEARPAALEAVRTVFADQRLKEEAGVIALGRADAEAISRAVELLASTDELHAREAKIYDPEVRGFVPAPGWTTADAVRTERAMLAIELEGRHRFAPIMDRQAAERVVAQAAATSEQAGYAWTRGQRAATAGLLASPHRVMGVQGYAGTAKTSTVLATYAGALRGQGYDVVALAPTNTAAFRLGEALDIEGMTVDRFLAGLRQEIGRHGKGASQGQAASTDRHQVWIVDEASMVSAKQMRDLLRAAEQQDARLALVGDVVQLGSVEAGRAFGQLQQAGMPTLVLDEIVRQTREAQKAAVEASIRADAAAALHNIERGTGQVIEIGEQEGRSRDEALEARHRALAEHYAALSPSARRGTIVIDPSREGRHALNEAIRDRLVANGELRGPEMRAEILEKKDLTKVEAKLALSYQPGDVVRFIRAYAPRDQPTITKGDALEVVDVRPEAGQVTLRKDNGRQILWEPKQWGAKSEAFVSRARTLMAGDLIVWTGKTPALDTVKGRLERVAAVDPQRNTAFIDRGRGRTAAVDLAEHKHWDHGYVTTAYQAQSRTAERVLAHLESWRVNLVNLRSFYVALSRAKVQAVVATDDRSSLIAAIRERSGEKMAALDGLVQKAGRAAEHGIREASVHRPFATAKGRSRGHDFEL